MTDKPKTLESVKAELAQVQRDIELINKVQAAITDRQKQIRGKQGRN